MAMRVLTDDERQVLLTSTLFLQKCEWAVRNYADYWAANDGAATNSEATRIKWLKDRLLSVAISVQQLNDADLALKCLRLSKGMQVDVAAAPLDAATLVAALLAANKFEEIASLYFTLQGENINFSVGGN